MCDGSSRGQVSGGGANVRAPRPRAADEAVSCIPAVHDTTTTPSIARPAMQQQAAPVNSNSNFAAHNSRDTRTCVQLVG